MSNPSDSPTPAIDAINAEARKESAKRQNGKGSQPRPTNREQFNSNYDRIFRKKK
jgi:hypothetical protein